MTGRAGSRGPWLYLDLDDVLCETTPALSRLHAERTGRRVALEEMQSFDLRISLRLDEDAYESFMRAAHDPEFLENMEPVPEAGGQLRRWRARGFQIAVTTGRPPSSEPATRRWLERHDLEHDALHMVDKYGRPDWHDAGAQPPLSLEQMRRLPFALAVEDSPSMAQYLATRMRVPVLLVDRPWNRRAEAPAGSPNGAPITRIRTLADVATHLARVRRD